MMFSIHFVKYTVHGLIAYNRMIESVSIEKMVIFKRSNQINKFLYVIYTCCRSCKVTKFIVF